MDVPLAETTAAMLKGLSDRAFQLKALEQGGPHAMDDLIEDFIQIFDGNPGWPFSKALSDVYRNFGIETGNALLPIYVAICECIPEDPREELDYRIFLDSAEWTKVVEMSRAALGLLERKIAEAELG